LCRGRREKGSDRAPSVSEQKKTLDFLNQNLRHIENFKIICYTENKKQKG